MSNLKAYVGSEIFYLSNRKLDPSQCDLPTIELDSIEQGTGKLLTLYESKKRSSQKNYFKEGQILFGKLRPYLKKFLRPSFSGICSSEIWVLDTLNKDILMQEYLFYLVQSSAFLEPATTMAGTKMPRSSWDVVSSFNYLLPDKVEQHKIVEILSDCDRAITLLEKQIAFEKQEFQGLVATQLNRNLEQYGAQKLGNFGNLFRGKGITKNDLVEVKGVPCLRYGEIYTDYKDVVYEFKSRLNEASVRGAMAVFKDDILLTSSGEKATEIGQATAYLGNENAYCGGDLTIWRGHDQNAEYMSYQLNSTRLRKQKFRLAQGQSVVHLNAPEVASLLISVPPMEQQVKFSKISSGFEKNHIIQCEKLKIFRQQKSGLLQQLLNGKLRVKAAA